jgi:hypothetical protein
MLYESNQLHNGVHFRLENKFLFLRMPSIYPIFAKNYRQINHTSAPDKDTILQEIFKMESERDQKEVVKGIRFRAAGSDAESPYGYATSNSLSITYDVYRNRYGLDL